MNHASNTVFTGLGRFKGKEKKEKSKLELLAIRKSTFRKRFEDWKKPRDKCITSEGGYFEGDKIVIDK